MLKLKARDVCFSGSTADIQAVAERFYERVCRTDFSAPGFCVCGVTEPIGSVSFRRFMVDVKQAMSAIHLSRMNRKLAYVSAKRFDQQESTKPHLDGGPAESLLMLGYEPTEVQSRVEITDYSRCAFDLEITPENLLATHNPMFPSGRDFLRPYTTEIPCLDASSWQIVCINNSSTPYTADGSNWLGTLHTATVDQPDETKRRIINSTMIASHEIDQAEPLEPRRIEEFVTTTHVFRRGYDKQHLEDDP